MYKMYVYSYFMLVISIGWLFMALTVYLMKLDLVVEWLVFSFNSYMIEIYLLIDWISCLFAGLVLVISSMVMIYSVGYMEGSKGLERFTFLVVLFVVSMLLMVLSPSLISVLLGWDMLGLVSYCLVIYYQNVSSYNSGMVTVLSNRVGDVGLLLAVGMTVMYGSWNIYMLESKRILLIMIMLASVTKSAQMPFSTWLPLAMAAPTPVSALVHSSTLVTAGIYLVIRFNKLMIGSGMNFNLLLISVFTMFMSGLMANFEFDLKKIIALSTLSQLGLMMMSLSLGFTLLGFYHLLTHAVFKSLLFLCAGAVIHNMGGNQDIRHCGKQGGLMPFVGMGFYISVFSLMGVPFLSGFYSKDMIMEHVYGESLGLVLLSGIVISVSLTVLYSIRLCYYMGFFSIKLIPNLMFSESSLMNFSMMFLMVMSVISGSLLNWCFFLDLNMAYLLIELKLMTLGVMILGLVLWFGFKSISFHLYFIKYLFLFNSTMWFMSFVHVGLSKVVLSAGAYLRLIDSVWIEVISSSWIGMKVILTDIYYMEFKIYNIIVVTVVLVGSVMILWG